MKWIKVDIPEFQEQSYIDIDKAFRLHIKLVKAKYGARYRIRAYFLVTQNVNKERHKYPQFIEFTEFKTKKEAEAYIKKLMGSFLEKEGE